MNTSHMALVRTILRRELTLREQELDSAQRYLDETAQHHASAMQRVHAKRALVAELRDALQEWPTPDAKTATTQHSSKNSEPEASASPTFPPSATVLPTCL